MHLSFDSFDLALAARPAAALIGGETVDLILQTGWLARAVLVLLAVMSVASWAIIFSKWGLFRRARTQSGRFLRAFRKTNRAEELAAVADQFRPSPLVGVFERAWEEFERQGPGNPAAIERAVKIGASEEISAFESGLSWLATTAAVTPFIGLFGTVWGIMDAFHGLGTAGAATLRAVAPGVSEALITTAAGLFAAVPALIAYNIFNQTLREFAARADDFGLELMNALDLREPGPRPVPRSPEGRR